MVGKSDSAGDLLLGALESSSSHASRREPNNLLPFDFSSFLLDYGEVPFPITDWRVLWHT